MSNTNFFSLTVAKLVRETADAVTVHFEVPESLKATYQFTQGQYLTLRLMHNGKEQRRAYSICTSPTDNVLAVTVKRVANGIVSNYICNKLEVGHSLQVMPPQGNFFTPLSTEQRKDYYLFGAGSGITPLMSILKAIVEIEPTSTVHLLYGNRSEDSIIFKQELDDLTNRYAGQLTVDHILSQPKREKAGGLSGLFSKGKVSWEGKTGRIDATSVQKFLAEQPKRAQSAAYFICGPNSMIDTVEKTLQAAGVNKKDIHAERFNNEGAPIDPSVAATTVDGAKVKVTLRGKTTDIVVPKGEKILDVLIKQKLDPPYSCTSGACSTCIAKVSKGSVKMDACFALDEDEVEKGYILTCQAHPTASEVELSYDV
jgi:ring-1,2-phenylacetyl-CoA epoxidase subunit PaaE